ncbi:hypothetical protein [Neisseria weaveri]|uniref:hypothetical protein n=1 Tax=Neisseria weaveri TaxID=28091 RepID=UPI000568BD28|nr:hypothetical protein [Neisseria weaveri]
MAEEMEAEVLDDSRAEDDQDLIDWSEKYDVTLTALINEYNVYIQTLKDVDEKASKYLLLISIFVAGFFTVISSSLSEKLRFNYPLEYIDLLSWFFITCLMFASLFSFLVVNKILLSLSFIESRRLADLRLALEETGESNSTEYKFELINYYQNAINFIDVKIKEKQGKLRLIYPNMRYAVIFILLSCFSLFLLRL